MARNDGKDRTVARNGYYTRSQIGNIERHNERKNESYQNADIGIEQSDKNIYFKKPQSGYIDTFDKMCEDRTISTKGLKDGAVHFNELLFDVNTTYFEERGGYEYAKEFFSKAYDYAVQKVGGENIFYRRLCTQMNVIRQYRNSLEKMFTTITCTSYMYQWCRKKLGGQRGAKIRN